MGCRKFASRGSTKGLFFSPPRAPWWETPFFSAPALSQPRPAFDWVSCPFQAAALEAQGLLLFSWYPAKDMALPGSRPVTGTRTCFVLWDPFFRRCSVQGNFPHPLFLIQCLPEWMHCTRLWVPAWTCEMGTCNSKPDPQTPLDCLLQIF